MPGESMHFRLRLALLRFQSACCHRVRVSSMNFAAC